LAMQLGLIRVGSDRASSEASSAGEEFVRGGCAAEGTVRRYVAGVQQSFDAELTGLTLGIPERRGRPKEGAAAVDAGCKMGPERVWS